ncbi:MAG: hypothetical protein AAF685_04910 [Cyanobacteria bacterium P01_C01_bin.89]
MNPRRKGAIARRSESDLFPVAIIAVPTICVTLDSAQGNSGAEYLHLPRTRQCQFLQRLRQNN